MSLKPKESGKFVAEQAKHVLIKKEGIEKLGNKIIKVVNSGELSVANFSQNEVHPKSDDPNAVEWLFVVDTLNFCFWSPEDSEGWTVEKRTGYFALCAAINRAIKENVNILNPKFYSTISNEQLAKVLRSDNNIEIPLFTERVKALHEVGAVLLENFEGSFANVVKAAGYSAVKLLDLIVENFKCFQDQAEYKGTKVSIFKRAQILVGDIWACYRNTDLGHFNDIDEITMFADYRVPQSLLYYNVFEYSDELNKILKSGKILTNGEEMEVEIRACSIHAVELLNEYVSTKLDKGKMINSILIDHYLWDFRRAHAKEILEMGLPFHKTFCIYY